MTGDLGLTWIRRTRFGGTTWELAEVPLNEEREAYRLAILDGETVLRTIDTDAAAFTYTLADQTADFGGPAASFTLRVAQLSAAIGAGLTLEELVHA